MNTDRRKSNTHLIMIYDIQQNRLGSFHLDKLKWKRNKGEEKISKCSKGEFTSSVIYL